MASGMYWMFVWMASGWASGMYLVMLSFVCDKRVEFRVCCTCFRLDQKPNAWAVAYLKWRVLHTKLHLYCKSDTWILMQAPLNYLFATCKFNEPVYAECAFLNRQRHVPERKRENERNVKKKNHMHPNSLHVFHKRNIC